MVLGNIGYEKMHIEATQRGYETIVISDGSKKNAHLPDQFVQIDTLNEINILKDIIKKEQPSIVISRGSPNFEFQSVRDNLLRHWLLNMNPQSTFVNASDMTSSISHNKAMMRHHFLLNDLPVNEGFMIDNNKGQLELVEKIEYPCVVKKVHGSSSEGVFIVNGAEQLKAILDSMHDQTFLIETFFDGIEVGLEVIVTEEDVYFYPPAFLGRTGDVKTFNRIRYAPFAIIDSLFDQITTVLRNYIKRQFEHFVGVIQFDLMVNEEENTWIVSELNARLSGVSDLNAALVAPSPFHVLLDLGENPSSDIKLRQKVPCVMECPVTIDETSIDQIKNHPRITYFKDVINMDEMILTIVGDSPTVIYSTLMDLPVQIRPEITEQLLHLQKQPII